MPCVFLDMLNTNRRKTRKMSTFKQDTYSIVVFVIPTTPDLKSSHSKLVLKLNLGGVAATDLENGCSSCNRVLAH